MPKLFTAGGAISAGMAVEIHTSGKAHPSNSLLAPQSPVIGVAVTSSSFDGDTLYVATIGEIVTVPNILGISPTLGQQLGDADGTGKLNTVTSGLVAATAISASAGGIKLLVISNGQSGADSLFASMVMTAAQFKALDNTTANQFVIIPAPGAGKIILLDYFTANMQFATTAYLTGTSALVLSYGAGANAFGSIVPQIISAAVLKVASGSTLNAGVFSLNPTSLTAFSTVPLSACINSPLVFNLSNATKYTAGDSPFAITCKYHVLSVK